MVLHTKLGSINRRARTGRHADDVHRTNHNADKNNIRKDHRTTWPSPPPPNNSKMWGELEVRQYLPRHGCPDGSFAMMKVGDKESSRVYCLLSNHKEQTPASGRRATPPASLLAPRSTLNRWSTDGTFSLQNLYRLPRTAWVRHALVTRWLAQRFVSFHSHPLPLVLPIFPTSLTGSSLLTPPNWPRFLRERSNHGYQWHQSPAREKDVYIGAHH